MGPDDYEPRHRGLPEVTPRRRGRGPVLPGLLVAATLVGFAALKNPTATWERVIDDARGGSSSFAFIKTESNGDPVGWDPCRPIHYVVNPEGAPGDWEEIVDSAVLALQDASDFRFVDDGTSSDRDFTRRTERSVLLAWADEDEVPKLDGRAAGIGGATPLRNDGRTRYVSGVIVLDSEEYAVMERTGRKRAAVLILAHEFGHVLGLDHVDDSGELMNPRYVGQRGFGSGDVRGFAQLHDLPCADT